MALAEVYVDESYDGTADAEFIHVAGYLFRRRKAKEFARAWGNYLRFKKLPYFHMSECAPGSGAFRELNKTIRTDIVRKLIELTKKHSEFGFAVTIRQADYVHLIAPREGMPESAYAFALFAAMLRVRKWTERTGFTGSVSYFFERGHKDKSQADEFMRWMLSSPTVANNSSYGSHTFVPKETPGLHPADMLAWQWNAEVRRRRDPGRRPVRKDFEALIRDQDFVAEYDLDGLQKLALELQKGERRRLEASDAIVGL